MMLTQKTLKCEVVDILTLRVSFYHFSHLQCKDLNFYIIVFDSQKDCGFIYFGFNFGYALEMIELKTQNSFL